jgi:hypothetical protein
MKLKKRDVFLLVGLLGLCGGLYAQFGVGWAAIAGGVIFLTFGLLGGDN